MNYKTILSITTIVINLLLWLSYAKDKPSELDFGDIKEPNLRLYLLISAGIAYLANLVFIFLLVSKKDISDLDYKIAIISILGYYILQLFFIPFIRDSFITGNKTLSRILLFACVIPIFFLAFISSKYNYLILKILSFLTLSHVLINDAIIYGLLF